MTPIPPPSSPQSNHNAILEKAISEEIFIDNLNLNSPPRPSSPATVENSEDDLDFEKLLDKALDVTFEKEDNSNSIVAWQPTALPSHEVEMVRQIQAQKAQQIRQQQIEQIALYLPLILPFFEQHPEMLQMFTLASHPTSVNLRLLKELEAQGDIQKIAERQDFNSIIAGAFFRTLRNYKLSQEEIVNFAALVVDSGESSLSEEDSFIKASPAKGGQMYQEFKKRCLEGLSADPTPIDPKLPTFLEKTIKEQMPIRLEKAIKELISSYRGSPKEFQEDLYKTLYAHRVKLNNENEVAIPVSSNKALKVFANKINCNPLIFIQKIKEEGEFNKALELGQMEVFINLPVSEQMQEESKIFLQHLGVESSLTNQWIQNSDFFEKAVLACVDCASNSQDLIPVIVKLVSEEEEDVPSLSNIVKVVEKAVTPEQLNKMKQAVIQFLTDNLSPSTKTGKEEIE